MLLTLLYALISKTMVIDLRLARHYFTEAKIGQVNLNVGLVPSSPANFISSELIPQDQIGKVALYPFELGPHKIDALKIQDYDNTPFRESGVDMFVGSELFKDAVVFCKPSQRRLEFEYNPSTVGGEFLEELRKQPYGIYSYSISSGGEPKGWDFYSIQIGEKVVMAIDYSTRHSVIMNDSIEFVHNDGQEPISMPCMYGFKVNSVVNFQAIDDERHIWVPILKDNSGELYKYFGKYSGILSLADMPYPSIMDFKNKKGFIAIPLTSKSRFEEFLKCQLGLPLVTEFANLKSTQSIENSQSLKDSDSVQLVSVLGQSLDGLTSEINKGENNEHKIFGELLEASRKGKLVATYKSKNGVEFSFLVRKVD